MGLLVALDEFKAYKNITNSEKDSSLLIIISAASQLAKTYCRRTFIDYYDTDFTEYFNGNEYEALFLQEFPLKSVTKVSVSYNGVDYTDLVAGTDYFVDYRYDAVRSMYDTPFTAGAIPADLSVKVQYKGGYERVPEDLKIAVLDLVEYYRSEEYTPRKSFGENVIENLGFREGGGSNLPANIKRVFEMYKAP